MVRGETLITKDVEGIVLHDAFQKDLGGNQWFMELMLNVKSRQARGIPITDVIIKEGREVLVGVLKHFFAVPLSTAAGIDRLGRAAVKDLAERILATKLSLSDISASMEKARAMAREKMERVHNGKPVKFSLSVELLGAMRFIFSVEHSGPVLNIRILDFLVPGVEQTRLPRAYVEWLDSLMEPIKLRPPFPGRKEDIERDVEVKEVQTARFRRGGLIVHCGPTGSGKTTSIASQIKYVAERISGLIVTYENPVEYVFINHPNVMQFELGQHVVEPEVYHHFLRMSAEACLVGEIKTSEEIFRAVDLASRGHIVWTTVHASSVEECLYLLKEHMKENMPLLLSSLLAITSQKLMLVSGKIVPVYQSLLFWRPDRESEFVQALRKQLEAGMTMQDIQNFIQDRMKTLRQEGYYIA